MAELIVATIATIAGVTALTATTVSTTGSTSSGEDSNIWSPEKRTEWVLNAHAKCQEHPLNVISNVYTNSDVYKMVSDDGCPAVHTPQTWSDIERIEWTQFIKTKCNASGIEKLSKEDIFTFRNDCPNIDNFRTSEPTKRYWTEVAKMKCPGVAFTTDQSIIDAAYRQVCPTVTATPTVTNKLYDFSSFTFTNAGVTGPNGPTLSDLRSNRGYSAQSWTQDYLNMVADKPGIQVWTVPMTGRYQIIAAGAAATTTGGGKGTIVVSTVSLTVPDVIRILVGQCGTLSAGPTDACSGGGGGTFVVTGDNTPLLIAGGGGFGGDGTLVPTLNGGQGGYNSGGGGGFQGDGISDGRQDSNGSGKSFLNGGVGGTQGGGINGGFGGGGAGTRWFGLGSGGAGGYNGGGTGGTSYDANGTNKSATRYTTTINGQTGGFNTSHGFVVIEYKGV